jgi:hypothetical protein
VQETASGRTTIAQPCEYRTAVATGVPGSAEETNSTIHFPHRDLCQVSSRGRYQ